MLTEVEVIALSGPDGDSLRPAFERDRPLIEAELEFLNDLNRPLPPSLPVTAMAIARRVQADVLADELPLLVSAAREDLDKGGGRGTGIVFSEAYDAAVPKGCRAPAALALELFADADIGHERASDEMGTDLFAVTTSRAAAITVGAADSKRSGFGPARVLTRTLRGFTLTLYALVYGATVGSRFGTAVVNAALATGGALLAVALIARSTPEPVKFIAALLVLAGLALAALRSRLWALALVAAIPMTAVLAVVMARDGIDAVRDNASVLGTVLGLVVALMLLGTVRQPAQLPWLARRKRRLWWIGGSLALVAVAACWVRQAHLGGIIGLEFAGTRGRAANILEKWAAGDGGLTRATQYIQRDFAFLAVYWIPVTVAIGWAAQRLTARGRTKWAASGASVAWLPFYGALLDATENALLLLEVDRARDTSVAVFRDAGIDYLAPLAAVAAGWKFVLLLTAVAYVAFAVFARRTGSPTVWKLSTGSS